MKKHDHRNITRYDDGNIDFNFYRRRALDMRSNQAWDMLSHIRQHLPFFRATVEQTPKATKPIHNMSFCR